MIEIQHLHKSFGKLHVLDDINLHLTMGRAVSLIGPNASGKTTMIKCLLGMVIPDSGTILFGGKNISHDFNYRSEIGYMPQIGRYPENMRVGQVFEMLQNIRQHKGEIDNELYEAFKMHDIRMKYMRTLSGGTRQKVSACLAFMFNPQVLILDEPTAGLDPLSAEILKLKILKEKAAGKLILITSHILSDLEEITTDILFIVEGKIKFYKTVAELQLETGEQSLNKAVAEIMRHP
ncbi:MAG: ABC transporter ATP-binding protein [Bacteroidetes bacterium]|nr:ABC transporter ATP-binding protein [Bacteroidota bacterium]